MQKKTGVLFMVVLAVMLVSGLTASFGAAKQTTIKFAVWDYTVIPDYKTMVQAFMAENPDIKIDIIDIAAKDYPDKMTIMLAGGEDVDVFAIKDFASYSNYVNRNLLNPLDSFVNKDLFNIKSYGDGIESIKNNGKLMALPYRGDIYLLYYNKDIFDKAKVPYPTNNMTWDQYREIAKKLTSGEGTTKVWGAFFHSWRSQIQCPILLTTKSTLIDGKYDFLKPAYELVLKMQNDDKSIMSKSEMNSTSAHYRAMFENGNVAMEWMGTWLIGSLIADKKAGKHNVNWDVAKAPHWPGVTSGSTIGNMTTLGMNAKSKQKNAAWKLMKFICGEKGAKILAKLGVYPALRNKEIIDIYTSADGFPAGAKTALVTDKVKLELPPSKYAGAIDKTLQEENDLILTGNETLDQGIANMNKRVADILAGN
jgi:multiple sugar transport system substrate-binding protein